MGIADPACRETLHCSPGQHAGLYGQRPLQGFDLIHTTRTWNAVIVTPRNVFLSIIHRSSLIAYRSSLIAHRSSLIAHGSWLIAVVPPSHLTLPSVGVVGTGGRCEAMQNWFEYARSSFR